MRELTLSKPLLDDVFKMALETLPNEVCGYLVGHDSHVTAVYPMKNIDSGPHSFSMDPHEQIEFSKMIREKNERILAVYHSHPTTPARLSAADLEWANDNQIGYVIVSLFTNPEAKVYFIRKPDDNSVVIEQGLLILS